MPCRRTVTKRFPLKCLAIFLGYFAVLVPGTVLLAYHVNFWFFLLPWVLGFAGHLVDEVLNGRKRRQVRKQTGYLGP